MEAITVKKIKPIFFQNGLPKKDCLKDVIEIAKDLKVKINKTNKAERAYFLNLINACLKAIRDLCREHHINWIDAKIPNMKYIKHGFTNNIDIIENSLDRCKNRKINHEIIYKKVKAIVNDEMNLFSKIEN
jgi:hypothetical protein